MPAYHEVKTVEQFNKQPEEYQIAVKKIVISHAINELYGAQVFDEPAIKLAPTPYMKWLTCRCAMEEYHHHVRFKGLADEIGVSPDAMDPRKKKPLSVFDFALASWEEFGVIKLLADLAEILQVEDLLHCSYVPLRNVARTTMPEEKFHAQFGKDICTELVRTPQGKARVQDVLNRRYPAMLPFFGKTNSRNNEIYRKYGLKQRRNDEMRADYIERVRELVTGLGLTLPRVRPAD